MNDVVQNEFLNGTDAVETIEPVVEPIEENETAQPDPILSEVTALRTELSELRRELDLRRHADEVNRRNASLSAGRVGTNVAPEYYTPDEVRAMSPTEVRENYEKIRASMKKW
ncbi:MAG: hypothetical protein J6Q82_00305 [Clostridia bacterium]|nr:hypothetical protein [Clostridia bacterium]